MAKGFNALAPRGGAGSGTPAHADQGVGPDRTGVVVNLVLLALFLAAARAEIELYLGSMFEDDAYFYFRIARNIAAGANATFDGLAPTNGFHPGWMAVLSAVVAVLQPVMDFETAVVLASALPVLPFALTLRPLWFLPVLAALALVGFGMEGVLAAAIALGLARAIDLDRPLLAGLAAAALVLTRIDLAVVPVVLALWFTARGRGWLALWLAVGAVAGAAAVIGVNLWLAGTPFSVSSMVKASEAGEVGPAQTLRLLAYNFSTSGNQLRIFIYAVALGWIAWHRRGAARAGFAAHPVFLGAVILFVGIHGLLSPLRDWYFAAPVLTALWAAGRVGADAPRAAKIGAAALTGLLPLAAAAWFQLAALDQVLRYRAELEAIDRALPPDAPLYAYDASGFVGHVMWPRPVINGDGLVNTPEYAARHRDPDWLFDYFRATGTRHVLSDFSDTLCITPWLCCQPGTVEPVLEMTPTKWVRSKAAWAFREGHACPIRTE